jgi:hypothetical protein
MMFSLIIPVKPAGKVRALESVALLAWPIKDRELLVAEGSWPSRQRNRAAAEASGEILYFLDDDSLVTSDNLKLLADRFRDPTVMVVGGPSLTPATDSSLQRGIAAALSSYMGGGGVRHRYQQQGKLRQVDERQLILCNLAVRRSAFMAAGGFDERLYPNEENELLDRLQQQGGKLLHDPELVVWRSQRSTLGAFCRQMFSYGRGRGEQTRIAGVGSVSPFLPTLFLGYLLTLPLVPYSLWRLPLALYLLLLVTTAVGTGIRRRGITTPFWLLLLVPLIHICYGAGLALGVSAPRHGQQRKTEEVTVRLVPGKSTT